MSTLKQRVTSLPYEDQIRLAREAMIELIEKEGFAFYIWCFDDSEFNPDRKRCCLGGAFFHKYGCYSSKMVLSRICSVALFAEGKNSYELPSLEGLLTAWKKIED